MHRTPDHRIMPAARISLSFRYASRGGRLLLLMLVLSIGPVREVEGSNPLCCPTGVRAGDLIFRLGRGWISDLILAWSGPGSKYSHVGVIDVEGGEVYVVHVEAGIASAGKDRVRKERMEHFLSVENARGYGLYRVTGLDSKAIGAIVNRLREYLRHGTPYDDSFDLDEDGSLYCTELVYRAFLAAGIDLLEKAVSNRERKHVIGGRSVFLPVDLLQSGKLVSLKTTRG